MTPERRTGSRGATAARTTPGGTTRGRTTPGGATAAGAATTGSATTGSATTGAATTGSATTGAATTGAATTGAEDRGARYTDLFASGHEHTSECAYCPFCTAIGAIRSTDPEVLDHLAAAARELVIAAGLFLERAGHAIGRQDVAPDDSGAPASKRSNSASSRVRRIDIG